MDQKIFSSVLSKDKNWQKEIHQFASKVKKDFGGKSVDLVIFFVSESYPDFDPLVFSRLITEELTCRVSIGCNSSGVIGSDKEVELEPAISIMAMHLPNVKLLPFYISASDSQYLHNGSELINFLDIYPNNKPRFICLADPNTCDVTSFLKTFNEGYKGLPVIGGLASGGVLGAPNWLSLNGNVYSEGLIGTGMVGDIEFEVIVSQGCRPIGKPFVITKAEDTVLYELAGQPALDVTRNVLENLSARDKKLSENSLFVGLVMNERQNTFKRGDFLVRNIMGFDPESGALMIGEHLKVGQTLQFQLRDAETSTEDLNELLGKNHNPQTSPRAGILVSCCGRGKGLFGKSDHDIQMIQQAKGPLPVTGFFANGEIGPIGEKNFVHGYTSSFVILK